MDYYVTGYVIDYVIKRHAKFEGLKRALQSSERLKTGLPIGVRQTVGSSVQQSGCWLTA